MVWGPIQSLQQTFIIDKVLPKIWRRASYTTKMALESPKNPYNTLIWECRLAGYEREGQRVYTAILPNNAGLHTVSAGKRHCQGAHGRVKSFTPCWWGLGFQPHIPNTKEGRDLKESVSIYSKCNHRCSLGNPCSRSIFCLSLFLHFVAKNAYFGLTSFQLSMLWCRAGLRA